MFGVFSYLQPYWLDTLLFENILHRCLSRRAVVHGFVAFVADLASFDNTTVQSYGAAYRRLSAQVARRSHNWASNPHCSFLGDRATGGLATLRRRLLVALVGDIFYRSSVHNNLLVPDYSLNYIYTSALSLAVVVVALHGSRASAAVAAVLAVVAGWGLEGIGGTLLAGAVGMMLAVGQFGVTGALRRRALATAAGAAAFSPLISPSAWRMVTLPWIIENMPTWLLFNCFTAGLCRPCRPHGAHTQGRRRMAAFVDAKSSVVYFFAVAVATMALSGMLARSLPRHLRPQVCAIVVWGMVLLPFLRRHSRAVKGARRVGSSVRDLHFRQRGYARRPMPKFPTTPWPRLEQPETLTAYMPLLPRLNIS